MSKILMPHINGKLLTNVFRKDTTHLWCIFTPSGHLSEFIYPSKKDINKGEQAKIGRWGSYIDPHIDNPAGSGYVLTSLEWKEVTTVRMGLRFSYASATNERSINYSLKAVDNDEQAYSMSESDFEKMMKSASMINGVFIEDWCFYRSSNIEYRIRPAWLEIPRK